VKQNQYDIHKEVVQQCQTGSRVAQNKLYQLYNGAMYNICKRMMGDDQEAKDLLQDAFVEAFTKIGTLKELNTFSAWMKRITINKCLNALKKRKIFSVPLDQVEDVPEDESMIDRDIIGFEADRVMKAVSQISEGCRTVLNLYLFEGYDHKEISQILSISESASKSQYCKAKQKIRDLLVNNKIAGYGNR
jgi:RNA polymerase sigma-70 factor (ECF subfamily)